MFGNKWRTRIRQHLWDNGFQTWVKRHYLYEDKELSRMNDWSVGFYYCEQCGDRKGFAYKIPPSNSGEFSKEAKNDWVGFLHNHAHGDGRALLFETKES